VIVPAGKYLTSAIFLKSNVQVEVFAGGALLLTTDFNQVPSVQGRWEGIDRTTYASLFNGFDLENVSITGRGTLDGQGERWWTAFRHDHELRRKLGLEEREPENPPEALLRWGRPRMINLFRCRNVQICGIALVDSPSWNIHPVQCGNLLIDGVTITAPEDSPNTDGIDPDSCKNVRIANCYLSVGDDCIIIKSGYKYRDNGIPCENITVTNCVFGKGHAGVGIGSETAGGVRNVVVSNCVCDGTQRGLRLKTARSRGNVVENIRASNVVMRDVGEAVVVTMFYTGGDLHRQEHVDQGTPRFRNIHFSDVFATRVKKAAVIEGLPEMPIEGLSISNFAVESAETGVTCTNAVGVRLDNIVVNAAKGPALTADTTRDFEINRVTTRKPASGEPMIRFANVGDAVVQSCSAPEGTGTFLELKGIANRSISLLGNRLSRAVREVELVDGATDKAIVQRS
jgi:polygalacturonase